MNDILKVTGIKKENIIEILGEIDFSKDLNENDLVEKKFFTENSYRKIKKKLLLDIADADSRNFGNFIYQKF